MTESLQPPPRSGMIREVRAVIELPRLLFGAPALARQPRGRGQPVLVIPGYGAGDLSTTLLKGYLRLLGYQVRGFGRGVVAGDVTGLLARVLRRLVHFAHNSRQEVQVIGWSLGGYLAREVARERPDLVGQVITLGTPVVGGPKYTVMAEKLRALGMDVDAMAAQVEARKCVALTTPVTAIYSRADAFVAWQACIDHGGLNVEHVEVGTTHVGLGFSPDVYRIIAQRLAKGAPAHQPSLEGARRPFTRGARRRRS